MVGIIFLIIILTAVCFISYCNLETIKKVRTKLLIIITICVFIIIFDLFLIDISLLNNNIKNGQGMFILIILIPIVIEFSVSTVLLLYTYLIDKYNNKKINKKTFIISTVIIFLLNILIILCLY